MLKSLRAPVWSRIRRFRTAGRVPCQVTDHVFPSEGGWQLRARRYQGPSGANVGLLVVPGLGGDVARTERWTGPAHPKEIASWGCAAVVLDLSGRGKSWGVESYGGPENHQDVRAALKWMGEAGLSRVGVLSLSLGASAAAGALASGGQAEFWIDWEGPSDREIITYGGRRMAPAAGHGLQDDRYWYPREPVRFVGRITCPYLRFQGLHDHAQPGEFRHAERMLRAASSGTLPWFQLNDHARGEVPVRPRWIDGGNWAAHRWIRDRVRELFGLP